MSFIVTFNYYLWNYLLVFLLLGTGLFFTFRLKAIQLRRFPTICCKVFKSVSFGKEAGREGASTFQALTIAIAGQVGTGNLAGTATAIVSGGPGAIFWMWLSALLGMGTIFSEAVLGQIYRRKVEGEVVGGPAYYIEHGIGCKKLAIFFSVCLILALGFIGNMVQANSIGCAFEEAFRIEPWIMGIGVAGLTGLVIQGGISSIASFTEKIVPIMALFYMGGCMVVLILRWDYVLPAFEAIINNAFNLKSAAGGLMGISIREAMRYGLARGLFSNEAGMGSTPHAHAIARVKHPCSQGEVAIFSVFVDTFVILTLTALVILVSPFYLEMISNPRESWVTSIALTQGAFSSVFGGGAHYFTATVLLFFAFSTIISWTYFALINIKYLFGSKKIFGFQCLVLLCIYLGTLAKVEVIWELSDTFNGLMCFPNLLALMVLRKVVFRSLKEYEAGQSLNQAACST